MKQVKSTLTELIRLLVNHPDDVSVTDTYMDDRWTFSVRVHPDDVGQVIGKQGRIARALRIIVSGIGKAAQLQIGLEIQDYQTHRE